MNSLHSRSPTRLRREPVRTECLAGFVLFVDFHTNFVVLTETGAQQIVPKWEIPEQRI